MPVDLLSDVTRTKQLQPKDLLAPQAKQPTDLLSPQITERKPETIDLGVFDTAAGLVNFGRFDGGIPMLRRMPTTEQLKAFNMPKEEYLRKEKERAIFEFNIPAQLIHAHPITSVATELATAEWMPGYPGKRTLQEIMQPKTVVADITNRVASLFGLWKGIKILNRTMPWMSLSGWKPTTQIGGLARHILRGGMKLGTYNLLTESGGRTLMENMKLRGISTGIGFGIGAVFEATGLLSGELVKDVAKGTFNLAIKDAAAQKAAFIMRLGANQMLTGVPAFRRFIRGDEHIPGLIFELGLGTMFSLSENPLRTEVAYNQWIKDKYKVKNLTVKELIPIIEKAGTVNNVPADIKWSYIIKTTSVKPSYQNAGDMLENEYLRFRDPVEYNRRLTTGLVKSNVGATDYIFEQALKINNPVTHGKLNFVQSVITDIEKEMLAQAKVPITEETTTTKTVIEGGKPVAPPVTPVITPTPTPTVSASEVPKGTISTFGILPGATRKFTVGTVKNELGLSFGTEQSFGKSKGKKQAVQLDITTPLVVKDPMAWDNPKAVLDTVFNAGALGKHEYLSMRSRIPSIKDIKYRNRNGTFNPQKFYDAQDIWYSILRDVLVQDKGYDSVIYKNEAEDPGSWSFKALKDDVIKKPEYWYHGTSEEAAREIAKGNFKISTFGDKKVQQVSGMFFSTDKEYAEMFSGMDWEGEQARPGGGKIIKFRPPKKSNLYNIQDKNIAQIEQFLEGDFSGKKFLSDVKKSGKVTAQEYLESKGYEGIILEGNKGRDTEILIFHPEKMFAKAISKLVDILKEEAQLVGGGKKEDVLPITRQVTEITSKIKVGGKDITTGHAWYEGPTLHLGYLETQPDFQRRGVGTRVIHNLINESLKTNKALVGVEGFIQSEGGAKTLDNFGAKFYDAGKNLLTNEQAINKVRVGEEVNYKIDFRSADFISSKAGQEMPWLSWVPRELVKQEDNLRAELATGKDITKLRKTARSIGLLYKSKDNKEIRNRLNTFLMDYYNIKYDKLNTLTGAQIEEARKLMQQLVPDSSGRVRLPKTTEILPVELIQEFRRKGNLFDWLQSGRIAVRPIYDLFKPAYQNMLLSREAKLDALRDIYQNKVKRGGDIDQKLALYSDGKINLDDIPEQYREIAIKRQDFYDKYADTLIERGFLDKKKVFNRDGTRKPYYHRIFDDVITRAYREGYAIEDLWLPGKLPTAGPLRKRLGKGGYKLSAIESDTEYVYAIEKYLNLKDANDVSIKYAQQYSGIRKSQADTYIRAMRGQPTKFDRQVKEAIQNISDGTADLLEKMGLKEQAKKLKEWSAPTYPLSRITSPLARLYYWRYIGFALDTAFKNSIQWEHASARYGWENVNRAFYAQFTPEGKQLIEQSGILREGIQRSRHFVEESAISQGFNKLEQAAYLAWESFETQNRNISGLAGYYEAMAQGKIHQQGLEAMRIASHETQYGYTKADSLLMDMSNPIWRFILFKKWPLAKVEMIRGWIKENRRDAILNLAMQEYVMYRLAQGIGIDLGGQFNAIWQLATRGLSTPADLMPLMGDITNIIKAFGTGPDSDKAREQLINNWQGLGNRYIGKVMNFWRAWQDDWNVREHGGQLRYQSTPKEQITALFTTPQESTERRVQMNRMRVVGNDVDAYREKAIRQVLAGDTEGAGKTMQEMLDKYSDEFAEYYGKRLEPINMDDVRRYMVGQETPILEKIRKQLPGKGAKPPAGYKFPKRPPKDLIGTIRGY